MKNLNNLIFIALAAFSGCSKTAIKSPSIAIKVEGHIRLIDENNTVVNDNTHILVTLQTDQSSFSIPVTKEGTFVLPDLKFSGIMSVVYSYQGYGIFKEYYSQQAYDSVINGTGSIQDIGLYPVSSVAVKSLTGDISNDHLILNCDVSVAQNASLNAIRFLVQKNNANVSFANCTSAYNISTTYLVTNGNNQISFCIKCLKDCGQFQPGDTIYLKAVGDIGYVPGGLYPPTIYYDELKNNNLVLPFANKNNDSQPVSFIMP